VLRFDWRGAGDSAGELEDATLDDWLDDLALVVQEGRRWSGAGALRLLAVRAGALLACKAVATCAPVDRVVLWDPVASGTAYLRAMRAIQHDIVERGAALDDADRRAAVHEFAGYRLSADMVDALARLDVGTVVDAAGRGPFVVATTPDVDRLAGATVESAPFPCHWQTDLENLMMPKPVLERLVPCLTRP
jgi:hypothetical protein